MSSETKTVIVTGASSGIGEATARLLARQGANLVLGARRTERLAALAAELGDSIVWAEADVSRREDMENLAALALRRFGGIDVLVNNAGFAAISPLEADLVDDWERMIDVNLKGPLFGIHAVLPTMLGQGSGQIVNVSSISGRLVVPGTAVYSATKVALNMLSEGLRKETAGKIRISVVSPGGTETEMGAGGNRLFATPRLNAASVAEAIAFVINQPAEVAINELVVRPIYEV